MGTILAWVIWSSVTLIAPLYYLIWFMRQALKIAPSVFEQFTLVLLRKRGKNAEPKRKRGGRARLGTSLMHTSAQILTALRICVVAGVAYQWWRMNRAPQGISIENIASHYSVLLTWILTVSTLVYLVYIDYARRRSELDQQHIDNQARVEPLSGPGAIWTRDLVDGFFYPALVDVLYITVVFFTLPGMHSDMHLALIVPVLSAWLFRNGFRIALLNLSIIISLLISWMWCTYCMESRVNLNIIALLNDSATPENSHDFQRGSLFGSILPRCAFWTALCLLMIVMRAIRRETEDQASFFQGLAEAMPFEVFVKDDERRFVYANQKLLAKLKLMKNISSISLGDVLGETDRSLGIDNKKSDEYRNVDIEILEGKRQYYEALEDSYEENSKSKILTIKVPIKRPRRGEDDKVGYVLGLSRDPLGDSDPYFFMALVGTETRHCFFTKEDSKFKWVNDQFLQYLGVENLDQVAGTTDFEWFAEKCADEFQRDDNAAVRGVGINRDEWNEPIGRPRRRVHVVKQQFRDYNGNICGVRGYFRDIHKSYLRRIAADRLLKLLNHHPDLNKDDEIGTRIPFVRLIVCSTRILNLRDFDFDCLRRCLSGEGAFPVWLKDFSHSGRSPSQLNEDLEHICQILMTCFPAIRFFPGPWNEATEPAVDGKWFQVAVFALGVNAALRIEQASRNNKGSLDRVVHIKAGLESGVIVISALDRVDNIDFDKIDQQSMLEATLIEDEAYAAGLQLLDRVSIICNGSWSIEPPRDGNRGALFTCRLE